MPSRATPKESWTTPDSSKRPSATAGLRATFYIVEKQEAHDTQNAPSARSFVYTLNKFGYKVRSKPLQIHETVTPDGQRGISHKGDWDVGIVVDMVRLAAHADAYVLVSGDGDYVEAIEYLQSEKGLCVEVISAAQCTSQTLLDTCDLHTDLADIPELFRRPGPPKQAVSPQPSAKSSSASPPSLWEPRARCVACPTRGCDGRNKS